MAEALYRLQDADLVLSLLRHGVRPSCIYLWPVSVMIDLHRIMAADPHNTNHPHPGSLELTVLRYFSRARTNFRLVPFNVDSDEQLSFKLNADDIAQDNTLLLPLSTFDVIPEDRYKHPASLTHLARCQIRETLLRADGLPHAIRLLPLPTKLMDCIDLLVD